MTLKHTSSRTATTRIIEQLNSMDRALLLLQQSPADALLLRETSRATSELRNSIEALESEQLTSLAKETESVIQKLSSAKSQISSEVLDTLFESFCFIRNLVTNFGNSTNALLDTSDLSAKLKNIFRVAHEHKIHSPTSENNTKMPNLEQFDLSPYEIAGIKSALDYGSFLYVINVTLVSDCLLKGPRVFMITRALYGLEAEIIKALPSLKDLENEKFDTSFSLLLMTKHSKNDVSSSIDSISEIEKVIVEKVSAENMNNAKPNQSLNSQPASPPVPQPVSKPVAKPDTSVKKLDLSDLLVDESRDTEQESPIESVQPKNELQPPTFEEEKQQEDDSLDNELQELVQLVTFKIATETYALGIQQVDAIIDTKEITRVPRAPSHIEGVINLRGEIIPVINTKKRLKLANTSIDISKQIIILSFEEEKVKAGFLVDNVIEVIRLPESSIEPPDRVSESVEIEFLMGVGKVNKRIIIILNAWRVVFGKDAPL